MQCLWSCQMYGWISQRLWKSSEHCFQDIQPCHQPCSFCVETSPLSHTALNTITLSKRHSRLLPSWWQSFHHWQRIAVLCSYLGHKIQDLETFFQDPQSLWFSPQPSLKKSLWVYSLPTLAESSTVPRRSLFSEKTLWTKCAATQSICHQTWKTSLFS